LRELAQPSGARVPIPTTPRAAWCWLRGHDRGDLFVRSRALADAVAPALVVSEALDGFRYDIGRDLSGFEDGTENPKGDAAEHAAFVDGAGAGLDGSSFVAVQRWNHDLDHFAKLSRHAKEHAIGRALDDNHELDDAPPSAHVKRTAQESFDPEAFVLRRSMPFVDSSGQGLVFVAFGRSFDAFEAQLRRMVGAEDGIVDGLFGFSRPTTGAFFWCPPVRGDLLDLRALQR
ncbi:MAG TPA: Dyp-type peroxidase, partial [Nannocystaceae bacterium]|nr:Dyp-type peroxidase [Nannocystaceae bacterium]